MKLYMHPLSSYCMKALTAFYELGLDFEKVQVNFGTESGEAFKKLWPIGKFPLLEDGDQRVPESTIIVEYLTLKYPGPKRLIPADPEKALAVRAADRFFDLYVHNRMQDLVADRIRPDGKSDPYGVAQTREKLNTALAIVEKDMADRQWATGDDFTLADCAAAPGLFYHDIDRPFSASHPNIAHYLQRLMTRPSFARALKEAEPFMQFYPRERK